jgi:hypothetical protein
VRFKPTTKTASSGIAHARADAPETIPEGVEKEKQPWRTEYARITRSQVDGPRSLSVGLQSDLAVIANAINDHKPHVAFNLLEEFDDMRCSTSTSSVTSNC